MVPLAELTLDQLRAVRFRSDALPCDVEAAVHGLRLDLTAVLALKGPDAGACSIDVLGARHQKTSAGPAPASPDPAGRGRRACSVHERDLAP
ncbi:MAG: hypothetical protein K8T90_02610 [Planctomycetes bacterium]|nr:hypothetical protein [Planctomycetota bacterium]